VTTARRGEPVPGPGHVLLAVAHGSRDPAARASVDALVSRVAGLAGGATVRAAFVAHESPALATALARERGRHRVTVVPLLLSPGYHLSTDVGRAARAAGVAVAGPLGPDPALARALAARLAEAGVPARAPVVLAAAGSSDPRAAGQIRQQARLLAAHRGAPVLAGFASAARPTVAEAVAALAARTARPVAIASYLIAPGAFHGRLRESGARWVSAPLGDHPAVATLVITRFRAAAGAGLRPAC
jgi:sirohydrochlorin ferrochelatase